MAPPRKKTKTTNEDKPSLLLSDFRTAWLVKKDDQSIEIRVKDEVFLVHKHVLTKHSEYFDACLKKPFVEGDGVIRFDDIDPKYLGFYIGVAYSYSSIVPHAIPTPIQYPEVSMPKTPLRDFVEVFKLCDRFVSPDIGKFIEKCVENTIGNGHRALYRSPSDDAQQRALIVDFADAFEALDQNHNLQMELGATLIDYFCAGISYTAWDKWADNIKEHTRFVTEVSKGFARHLKALEASGRKLKRKELSGPKKTEHS